MWRPVPFPEDFCGEIGFLETRAPVKARAGSVLRGRGFRCRKQLHDRLPLKGGKLVLLVHRIIVIAVKTSMRFRKLFRVCYRS
jgi:hypothetical protein